MTNLRMLATFTLVAIAVVAFPATPKTSETRVVSAATFADSGDDELRDSLKKQPWFSPETDSPIFLPDRPQRVEKSAPPPRRNLGKSSVDLEGPLDVARWIILGVLLVAIAVFLIWLYRRVSLNRANRVKLEFNEAKARERRLETIAEEAREYYDDLKSAAAEAVERGDYRKAIVFLFSWILIELDKREFVLLEKGKTNLEYWRELSGREKERALYRDAMRVFERVYFGDRNVDRFEFAEFGKGVDEFETIFANFDQERAILEAQRLNAQNAAVAGVDAARWQAPNVVVKSVLILALVSLCATCGCKKRQKFWQTDYDVPLSSYYAHSINGVSCFEDYCDSIARRGVRRMDNADLTDATCDTVVWFGSACSSESRSKPLWFSTYSPAVSTAWDLVSPGRGEEDDDDGDDDYVKCLKRYAECDPDADWRKLCLPRGDEIFVENISLNANGMAKEWLEEKPGRVLVCVFNEWDAYPEYSVAAERDIEKNVPEDLRGLYSKQLETRIASLISHYKDCPEFSELGSTLTAIRKRAAIELLERKDHIMSYRSGILIDVKKKKSEEIVVVPNELAPFFHEDLNSSDDAPKLETYDPLLGVQSVIMRAEIEKLIDCPLFSARDFSRCGVDLYGDKSPATWCRSLLAEKKPDFFRPSQAKVSGDPSWIQGLPETLPMREWTTLEPGEGTETLVALDGVPIVCSRKVGESKIIFVNSTSFLSNYALTDRNNRALARRLSQEFNCDGSIYFVFGRFAKSYKPSAYEPEYGPFSLTKPSAYTFFIWHVVALAALICFLAWPVFGRPKRLASERNNNFGRHIAGMANLLQGTDSVAWVKRQIETDREARGWIDPDDASLDAVDDASDEKNAVPPVSFSGDSRFGAPRRKPRRPS